MNIISSQNGGFKSGLKSSFILMIKRHIQFILEGRNRHHMKNVRGHGLLCLFAKNILNGISIETLGLMLQESKALTNLQESIVTHQIDEYIEQENHCSHCHSKFSGPVLQKPDARK
jgi:hypothetical protein